MRALEHPGMQEPERAGKRREVEPELLSYPEAACYLQISERFLRALVSEGRVRVVRLNKRALFRRKHLDELIERNIVAS